MASYWEIEADHPALAEVRPVWSPAWYRLWRELHLAKYPDIDQGTKDNLDMFVERAEQLEAEATP